MVELAVVGRSMPPRARCSFAVVVHDPYRLVGDISELWDFSTSAV
jgi:hypothetical protein